MHTLPAPLGSHNTGVNALAADSATYFVSLVPDAARAVKWPCFASQL